MGWGLGADSSVGENESRVSIGRKREKRGIVAVCSQQKREKKKERKKRYCRRENGRAEPGR